MDRHVACYLRVSTDGQSVDMQRPHCLATAEKYFPGLPVVEYIDEGQSASKKLLTERPAAVDLLAALDDDQLAGIVVYKQDRISRHDEQETAELLIKCGLRGIAVYSATEGQLSMKDFSDRMTALLRHEIAREEAKVKADRARDGRLHIAQQGLWSGGPTPRGYRRLPDKSLEPDANAPFIAEAFERRSKGASIGELAQWLSDTTEYHWHRHNVRDAFRNRAYIGLVTLNDEDYQGKHSAIVSIELFEQVQMQLDRDSALHLRRGTRTAVGSLLRCRLCSAAMAFEEEVRVGTPKYTARCLNCRFTHYAEVLEMYLAVTMQTTAGYLRQRLADPEWRSEDHPEEEAELRDTLSDISLQRERLLDLVQDGDRQAKERYKALGSDVTRIERRLRQIAAGWEAKRITLAAVADAWESFSWRLATTTERRDVVRATVEALSVDPETFYILPRGMDEERAWDFTRTRRRSTGEAALRTLGYGVPDKAAEAS